jgi:hypothetical protein
VKISLKKSFRALLRVSRSGALSVPDKLDASYSASPFSRRRIASRRLRLERLDVLAEMPQKYILLRVREEGGDTDYGLGCGTSIASTFFTRTDCERHIIRWGTGYESLDVQGQFDLRLSPHELWDLMKHWRYL